ncbi:hypothetical protein HY450_02215 [Candidatus Pacearchaeota archaeon]|nr:hypothetical protein [Candidatus Pacearchaeota archaeon]
MSEINYLSAVGDVVNRFNSAKDYFERREFFGAMVALDDLSMRYKTMMNSFPNFRWMMPNVAFICEITFNELRAISKEEDFQNAGGQLVMRQARRHFAELDFMLSGNEDYDRQLSEGRQHP